MQLVGKEHLSGSFIDDNTFLRNLQTQTASPLQDNNRIVTSEDNAEFLKVMLDSLKSVGPTGPLPKNTPEIRLEKIADKINFRVRQITLTLIALERDYLMISESETKVGMELCQGIELMAACGIKTFNNGNNWIFIPSLPDLLNSPEGFAFYLPLITHLAGITLSSKFFDSGLMINLGWDPIKLQPMESFLRQGVDHSNHEVKILAKGFLAMLEFNQKAHVSQKIYASELYPFMLRLERDTSFFSDKELLRLLPVCAPALHQLLLCDLEDINAMRQYEIKHGQAHPDEFRREIYNPKQALHDDAKNGYIESQNKLYALLFNQLPNGKDGRANYLYSSRILFSHNELCKKNPYPVELPAQTKQGPSKPKKTKQIQPRATAKSKGKQQVKSAVSKVNSPIISKPITPVFPSWIDAPLPFAYHPRVLKWLNMDKKDYLNLEAQRVKHGFAPFVDKLVRLDAYAYHREDKRKQSYYLIAQFEYTNGSKERGVIAYGTFGQNEKEKCYHRYFSKKRNDELLQQSFNAVFKSIDDDFTDEDDGKFDILAASLSTPRIEIEPLLGLIKIHDEETGTVISIFKLPIPQSSAL
ncbi:MAG: hypothetical protein H0V82_12530 [Candidatus Protochlamydia sp.]|nr:hypothetical protein [Candidatus Protochlamydia sp.]